MTSARFVWSILLFRRRNFFYQYWTELQLGYKSYRPVDVANRWEKSNTRNNKRSFIDTTILCAPVSNSSLVISASGEAKWCVLKVRTLRKLWKHTPRLQRQPSRLGLVWRGLQTVRWSLSILFWLLLVVPKLGIAIMFCRAWFLRKQCFVLYNSQCFVTTGVLLQNGCTKRIFCRPRSKM